MPCVRSVLHKGQQPNGSSAQKASIQMALWTPQVQVSLALTNHSINPVMLNLGCVGCCRTDGPFITQVQAARGRLPAAAADSLRERGTDRAANEGKTN